MSVDLVIFELVTLALALGFFAWTVIVDPYPTRSGDAVSGIDTVTGRERVIENLDLWLFAGLLAIVAGVHIAVLHQKVRQLERELAAERPTGKYRCGCPIRRSDKVMAFCPTHHKLMEEVFDGRQ